jgi:glyceraldehyde 3-phosphate dehydrogenase
MAIRVGINGFGRIGRQVLRAAFQQGVADLEFVAINDLTDTATLAHLFAYDSVHGRYDGDVTHDAEGITVDGVRIRILAERDPARLPWKELGADIVLESTGRFTNAADARKHLEAGARKVIISAPATNEDLTVVMGVNSDKYDPAAHHIISNASCTTNCRW